jgi:hypothetical protein
MKGHLNRLLTFRVTRVRGPGVAAAIAPPGALAQKREGERAGVSDSTLEASPEPRLAELRTMLSELDAEQLITARRREVAGEGRQSVLQRIDLLLANVDAVPSERHGQSSAPTLLSIRHLVDDSFGEGTFRVLSRATLHDVGDNLRQGRFLDAAFSAAHYLVLGHDPGWSPADHRRMVEAKSDTVEQLRRRRALKRAASACASLRLLQPDPVPADLNLFTSVLRSDLEDRLSRRQLDIRTAGTAADLYLLSGQWLPDERDSPSLILAVDSAARGQSDNDPIIEAARLALWLVVTRASGTGIASS